MLVLREERHEDLLVSVGRRQVDGRGAARGHPSPLLLLLSKLCQVAVLAVVEQVDESFGVTGGGRVVHGAQAAVVPQGGVGLVLCERRGNMFFKPFFSALCVSFTRTLRR